MVEGRVDGLIVIGAGLPRTGTLSTRSALELLLGGPCYHGSTPVVEQPEHQHVWQEAFNTGIIDPVVERGILDGFRAGLDYPFMCWYKELFRLHPTAKVLLTVRDPGQWFASSRFLIDILLSLTTSFPYSWFLHLVGLGKFVDYVKTQSEHTFGLAGRYNEAVNSSQDKAVEFFNAHIEEVKSVVPKDKLLVFDVRDGWDSLCKFLDLPIPDIPFPNINDRRQILLVYHTIRCMAWVTLLGLPVLLFYAICVYTADWGGLMVTFALTVGLVLVAGQLVQALLSNLTTQKTKKI